jgi:eukaryotic-like serine/threonine-protein kinase
MSLTPGTRIGPYTIVSAIGAGGMGVVYRATDTRLGRDVAIKVLPDDVANEPDRLARFEREARALAALNHFNIAQVYGFEGRALIMELLEGETLRERLSHGPLPIRKAIEYATQIARGLAAAHDRGIVHRDLKPENVFIVEDGHVKLLDFGLAWRDAEDVARIETQPAPHPTAPGTVLGTVGYMSPEQVRGLSVDARSDLFSLGTVLYEMLTGERAFRGASSADTMAAILNEQPRDLTVVRPDVSAALGRIVYHCLEKTAVERFQSARDVAFSLEALSGSMASPVINRGAGLRLERIAWSIATTILAAALLVTWTTGRVPPSIPIAVSRTMLVLPDGISVNEVSTPGARLAISPDGSKIVFQGQHNISGQPQLFLQPLDGGETTALAGTQSAYAPFWSPDGREIMFFTSGSVMRLSLDGGGPVAVTRHPSIFGWATGGWGTGGVILLGGSSLQRVPAQGGSPSVVYGANGTAGFVYPQFLPDERRFLFGQLSESGEISIVEGRVDSSAVNVLLTGTNLGKGVYANGALLFARGSTLFAQRAEGNPLALTGNVEPIAHSVGSLPTRGAVFSASNNGVLVYQTVASRRASVRLTWIDRQGRTLSTVGEDDDYSNVELTGDGRRALVSISDPELQTRDIFIIDLIRGVRQRFTTDASDERSAVWSPDDRRVIYNSKGFDLYARAADSSGDEQPIMVDGRSKDANDWSPDGRTIVYRRIGPDTGNDLWIAPVDGKGPGRLLTGTRFSETFANFSPDGRFVVYSSDESGQPEIYVVNVAGGGKIQVSANGGLFPRWRGDGREILYIATDRSLMSAAVESATELKVLAPQPLFKINVAVTPGPSYDVTRDGERFLVATPMPSRIPQAFTVVTNWPRLLDKD